MSDQQQRPRMTFVLEKQQSELKHSISEPDITTHSPEMEPVRRLPARYSQ